MRADMNMRKVQLTGGSSLTVTLPKAWVDRTKLRRGDVVGFIELPDGSLAIRTHLKGDRAPLECQIEVEESEGAYLFRKIVAAYLSGFEIIRLHAKRPLPTDARLTIRNAVRRIVGLEITEEQPSAIVLQDFLDPREFHIEKAVRRMGLLTQAMQEEAVHALKEPRPDVLQSEEDRDSEVDRLYWLVNKQYHALLRDSSYAARTGLNASQALNFLLVARLLERSADHADRVASEALQLAPSRPPGPLMDRIDRHARRAVELHQNALQTFYRKDAKRADAIIEETDRHLESQKKLLREATELGGEAVAHLAFILESIGRTGAYAADIAELAVNHKAAFPEPRPKGLSSADFSGKSAILAGGTAWD